jgi:hypothetical protein
MLYDSSTKQFQHNESTSSTQISCSNLPTPPSCIVIGCKNGGEGATNSTSVKYYQVPSIQNNHIARQWYINTLREDLLDSLLTHSNDSRQQQQAIHFVCIEHFDEESFVVSPNNSSSLLLNSELYNNYDHMIHMILKEDAVPSLFEIEVFQKMIAHQEQIAMQQQQQQLTPQISLESSLNNSKRSRMDPDFRAALIQRVPKALKRTSPIVANITLPVQPTSSNNPPPRIPKALKRSLPPQQTTPINQIPTENKQNFSSQKMQKAVKHTFSLNTNTQNGSSSCSINSTPLLKDLLPPPIMQSTKRSPNNTQFTHKAVKRTTAQPSQQHQQPLCQISLNNLELHNNNNNKQNPITTTPVTPSSRNTITTTYVYKRISQQPEIDLDLECEEEEFVYIKVPPPTPPKSQPKPDTTNNELNKLLTDAKSIQVDMDFELNQKIIKKQEEEKQRQINNSNKNDAKKTTSSNSYINVLERFYARKQGTLENYVEANNSKNKKTKLLVPADLRIGNYPVKVNDFLDVESHNFCLKKIVQFCLILCFSLILPLPETIY